MDGLKKAVLRKRLQIAKQKLKDVQDERDAERDKVEVEKLRLERAHMGSLKVAGEKANLARQVRRLRAVQIVPEQACTQTARQFGGARLTALRFVASRIATSSQVDERDRKLKENEDELEATIERIKDELEKNSAKEMKKAKKVMEVRDRCCTYASTRDRSFSCCKDCRFPLLRFVHA